MCIRDRPSLTPLYIAIFVNENEAHDLFGVNIVGNHIDFEGAFYRFAEGVEAPMSIVSPEQLAAREKAAKIAKAKAAKAAKEKAAKEAEAAAPADAPAEEQPQKQAEAASAPAPASAEASANTNEEGE